MGKPAVRKLLLPFSLVYQLMVQLRNRLFESGVLKQECFPPFILTVGNIQAGGTGKTPHVIALAEILHPDYPTVIVSRGYKRKSNGFRWVNPEDDPALCGDEPLEIRQKLGNIPVAVDGNRRRAIGRVMTELFPPPQIILLDDGFQHRYVRPDFSLVLTRKSKLYSDDRMLPAGDLREPKKNINRANAVWITYADDQTHPEIIRQTLKLPAEIPLWASQVSYSLVPEIQAKAPILLVTSVADPQEMIASLKQPFLVHCLSFPDHHRYTEKDLSKIIRTFNSLQGKAGKIVTTGKDLVKLKRFSRFSQLPVSLLQANMKIDPGAIEQIKEHVTRYYYTD